MEKALVKIDGTGKGMYERLIKEVREYVVKESVDCGIFFNMEAMHQDMERMRANLDKIGSHGEGHVYSKSEMKKLAEQDVRRKLSLYRDYFMPGCKKNISWEIASHYAGNILRQLEVWRRAVRLWCKKQGLALPAPVTLRGLDGAEIAVNFGSRQKLRSNLREVIAKYIDENLLADGIYADDFYDSDVEIDLESYIPMQNYDLSPFEEQVKKFMGCYEAWLYNLNTDHLDDKVTSAAKICERNFFRRGYIQDMTHTIFDAFAAVLQAKEAA